MIFILVNTISPMYIQQLTKLSLPLFQVLMVYANHISLFLKIHNKEAIFESELCTN